MMDVVIVPNVSDPSLAVNAGEMKMNTSLGYHTLTIYRMLTVNESLEVQRSFAQCKEVYFGKNHSNGGTTGDNRRYGANRQFIRSSPSYRNIYYRTGDIGLKWSLKHSASSPTYMRRDYPFYIEEDGLIEDRPCCIRATINPKILTGIVDYIAAADSSYLNDLIEVFNCEARKISPILRDFNSYSLNRTDYCVNYDLAELEINSLPEIYMPFIKRADIPHSFEEFKIYDTTSHRYKPGPNSFYLMNKSVRINCYCKHSQLEKQYPFTPNIDDSRNVIRFEIQCLYPKVQYMQKQIKGCDDFEDKMAVMLSDEFCTNILKSYFYKTIGAGDYYVLDCARDKIKSMKFKQNKETRLIDALELVNKRRGIFHAKSHLEGAKLDEFERSIKDLGKIGINPVTIPRELRIKHLPNLMTTYLDQREKQEAAWAAAYPKKMYE